MSEVFDPYRKWLGIAPHEQPAHHYRLLGIAPFEDDPDVIENAADRQMAHVRTYQSGRHRDQSQRILNELAAAKNMLLDPAKKVAYDAWLHEMLNGLEAAAPLPTPELPAAPLPAPPPPAPPPPRREQGPPPPLPTGTLPVGQAVPMGAPVAAAVGTAPVAVGAKPRSVRARARRRSSPVGIIIGCAVVGIALVAAMVVVLQQTADTETPKNPAPPVARKTDSSETAKTKSAPAPRTEQKPDKVVHSPAQTPNQAIGVVPKPADLPPDQQFKMALIEARDAMGQRDLAKAKAAIASAESAKESAEDTTEVERLQTLEKYLDEFWKAVRAGVDRSEPSDVLHYEEDEMELVARDGEMLTIQLGEKERKFKLTELPPQAAALFARKAFDTRKDAKPRLYLAAFWTLDAKAASLPKASERARRLWSEAAQLGSVDLALANAMGLDEEFISSVKPKPEEEPLPKLPSVEKPDDDKSDE